MAKARKLRSGRWFIQIYLGKTEDGTPLRPSFTADTKQEVLYLAAQAKIGYDRKSRDGITLGEAMDKYISSKDAVLSPSTIRIYNILRKNAYPGIIDKPVSSITQEDVQKAINAYALNHQPKTVRNANGLLSAVMKMFADKSFQISLPQKRKQTINIPTQDQVNAMVSAAKGTLMETVILLAASLGLRRSEICALTWQDIDLKAGTLTVNKAMVRDNDNVWVVKPPKSTSGTRTLTIPPPLMDHLKSLPRPQSRLVPISPDAATYRFETICKHAGVTCHLHHLRHFYASLLLALGVPDKYAMKRMGHATPNMLKNVYQHLMDDKDQEIDNLINSHLTGMLDTTNRTTNKASNSL